MKQLLDTIEKAKEALNLSERELSTKIGQHYTYLGKIKKKGTSEKNQQVIIEKIVNLMNGNPVTDAEIIKSLSLRLQAEQDKSVLLQAAITDKNTEIMNWRESYSLIGVDKRQIESKLKTQVWKCRLYQLLFFLTFPLLVFVCFLRKFPL